MLMRYAIAIFSPARRAPWPLKTLRMLTIARLRIRNAANFLEQFVRHVLRSRAYWVPKGPRQANIQRTYVSW
jgi:hypothetical protein